jgi:tetratricopeptide (TPR) repeat protein
MAQLQQPMVACPKVRGRSVIRQSFVAGLSLLALVAFRANAIANVFEDCSAPGISPDRRLEACNDALAQSLAYSDFGLANRNKLAAYLNRAGAYLEKGENDWAILDASRVIELDPTVAQAHYYLASAYYNKRDYDQAIANATKAISMAPQGGWLAAAYNVRGRAYTQKANLDQAVADLTKAIGLDGKAAAFFYNRSIAYSRMPGGTPKAIADLQTVVQLAPADSALRANAQTGLSQLQRAATPAR